MYGDVGVNILALLQKFVYSIYSELNCYISSRSVAHISKSQLSGILDISIRFFGEKCFLKPIQYRFMTCIPAEIQHKLLFWQQHVLDEYHKELTLNKPSDNLYHHYSPLKWNCFSSKTEETSSNPRFLQKDYRYQKTVSRVNYLTCSKLQAE